MTQPDSLLRNPEDRCAWLADHVLPHEPALRRWLRRVVPAWISADDVIQESYARLVGLDNVAHILDPRSYFFQTAKSLVFQEIRRAKVVPIESLEELESPEAQRPALSAEQVVSGRRELARLHAGIEALPQSCREVFVLRRFEGLSQQQVAQHLGISVSGVEKQLARAMQLLLLSMGRGSEA